MGMTEGQLGLVFYIGSTHTKHHLIDSDDRGSWLVIEIEGRANYTDAQYSHFNCLVPVSILPDHVLETWGKILQR